MGDDTNIDYEKLKEKYPRARFVRDEGMFIKEDKECFILDKPNPSVYLVAHKIGVVYTREVVPQDLVQYEH